MIAPTFGIGGRIDGSYHERRAAVPGGLGPSALVYVPPVQSDIDALWERHVRRNGRWRAAASLK